ncbi:MAG: NuoM family protein [Candidatus Melainabacteria bacterium]|nr:NuoM family protein [Candidatus Melainabacteria bacterium]
MEKLTQIFLQHALTTIVILPLIAVVIIAFLPSKESLCRLLSLIFSLDILLNVLVVIFSKFDPYLTALQYVENYRWFGDTIRIKLGVDGLSIAMVLLMAILLPVTIIASEPIAKDRPKLYYSMLMLLSTSVFGVFVAQDLFLFFLLWELELIPMYFLIAVWGGPNKNYAAMKFLIYTFIAGVCMFAAVLLLFFASGANTFDMEVLSRYGKTLPHIFQLMCFLLFFLCFIIKLPSFPFHTWLPDAHVEAPTPVSMLLAGILLKMGGYGIYRICVGFFPDILAEYGLWITILASVNIVGAAVACLAQDDMKRIIAYSSVSHMGFVLLGVASLTQAGFSGGIFQMFSHGLISAALFMLVGTLYERTHTRLIADYGGMTKYMPRCFYLFTLAALANLALPALSGFVGESLVFYGAFSSKYFSNFPTTLHFNFGQICVLFSALGVILTAGYMLWLLQKIFMGPENPKWSKLTDLRTQEVVVLGSLLALVVVWGIYPISLSNLYEPSLSELVGCVIRR